MFFSSRNINNQKGNIYAYIAFALLLLLIFFFPCFLSAAGQLSIGKRNSNLSFMRYFFFWSCEFVNKDPSRKCQGSNAMYIQVRN